MKLCSHDACSCMYEQYSLTDISQVSVIYAHNVYALYVRVLHYMHKVYFELLIKIDNVFHFTNKIFFHIQWKNSQCNNKD